MKTKLKYLGVLLLSACWLGSSIPAGAQQQKADRPNIIYILVDDMGIGDLGVYYQNFRRQQNSRHLPYMQTPHIDQLARTGAMITQGYVNAPVCVSSRASFLLGRTQGHTQVRDNQFDKALDKNYNIANTLKMAGYTTAAIGKWGLQGKKGLWPTHPLKIGFDYYYGYIRHGDGHEHYPKEGKYRGVKEVYDQYDNVTPGLDKCYTGDLWTARAKRWMQDYVKTEKKQKPFFLYLAYDTPHAVIELPTQAYPAGGGLKGGLQWLGQPGKMINTASGEIDSWVAPAYAQATWDHDNNPATAEQPWPDVYKRYATSIQRIDEQVGDILQLLKDLGIEENTLLVFSSDNGPSSESYLKENYSPEFFRGYGPFDGIKRDVWEGGLRVPFLVQWPDRIKGGTVIDKPMIASDWLTTFLAAAGKSAPANMDGVSLLPDLTGKGNRKASRIYVEYNFGGRTPDYADFEASRRNRRRRQMQLIRLCYYVGVRYDIQKADDPFEIYQVISDPKQQHNLAGEAAMQSLQAKMQEKVTQMRRPEKSAKRPYDSAFVKPVSQVATGGEGFNCRLFESADSWVPEVEGLKSIRENKIAAINSAALPAVRQGVYLVTGFIDVPSDGAYEFQFKSDGSAVFKLHEILLIDADFGYKGKPIKESILLRAGKHPFRFYYRPASGTGSFELTWSAQGAGPMTLRAK